MKKHKYNNFIIEISNDSQYTFNSTDNKNVYEKILFGEDKDGYFTSTHGIKIFADGNQISSCLVADSGGATGIHETCSLIDDGKVLICCGDSVFCLTLPDLAN